MFVCSQADRTHQPRADPQPQPAEDKQHPPHDVSSITVCRCVKERKLLKLYDAGFHDTAAASFVDVRFTP
jgi:hypothetical protein